ncbi:MAG TPA: hypothetical protein VFM80_09340 [Gracilimonas sp.]|uniref:hypothetical protein n=1 Tax=Gracilimonas sp. TaxID=1974203 RepID=UPI002D9C1CA9|nr:hypothetical protein [Gracilimonas sp.]
MSNFYSFTAILLLFTLIMGCTRNDAQREFEEQAYSAPNNFTETTSQGAIQSVDEDDWRTSPLFQGLIEIVPPFPNPVTTNQTVQFEVEVTGVQSVTGIEVLVRLADNNFRSLYQSFQTLEPGLTTFPINPIEFGINGTPEAARGLNRIYIFNANNQMISYGDILVE